MSLPKNRRKRLGDFGESFAATFLRRQGYSIVETDWRCRAGQLDIVATDGEYLVFVEVKTRRGLAAGLPEESLTPAKRARLIALAETYLQAGRTTDSPECWRIDVVAIELNESGVIQRVELIKNAIEGAGDR
ncbi:MAG: YraN family protein [Chloroflexi bacterium]|nr:YraN family protein [Chloroflexota bacterium]